jgi:hypothetical protein
MQLNSWPGLIAIILAIISFYGMTYVVIALNMGWRFGYWISGATFGALMVLLSILWIVNPVGPRGKEARWVPLAAAEDRMSRTSFNDKPLTSPAQYPSGPWRTVRKDEAERSDGLTSSVTACITTEDLEKLDEIERAVCDAAQKLMPGKMDIPVIDGSAVAVSPDATDTRFATESGALLGQVTVVPTTHDPRVAKDAVKGKPMGKPFLLLAVYDKGSLRVPAFAALSLFILFLAFHLAGLHRAEQRKLSPIAA